MIRHVFFCVRVKEKKIASFFFSISLRLNSLHIENGQAYEAQILLSAIIT